MTMRTERIDKWVRAYLDGVAIVESRDPLLFWEQDFPVPSYAFAHSDVRTDLLTESHGEPPQKPSFFLPKGPVSQWYDVTVGRRTAPHAAWVRDTPELSDRLVLSWQPGLLDRWLEEDEQVAGHPRDPYKRVETLASSRHVVLRLGDLTLADSARPILLLETSLPTRYYLPREDVNLEALTPSSNRSHCPYKGIADQYWSVTGNPDAVDIAWSYSAPLPAVEKVAGRVAFYNEFVDITVDGAPQPRPTSPFSAKEHLPTI